MTDRTEAHTFDLVDIGVNLTHKRFDRDRDEVIDRALEAGVTRMLLTGVDEPGSLAAARLAAGRPRIFRATAGVHPHHASDWTADTAAAIRTLAAGETTVALGETGLDFNRDFSPRPRQERAFAAQLELAAELGLPVFLHQRDAQRRFLDILREYRDALTAGGVVHCYTGDRAELRSYLDLDLHIGVTGWLCDERRGEALRGCVGDIPAERFMIETDAPFLLPRDMPDRPRNGRNEPAFLPHVLSAAARLRGVTPTALALSTTRTAEALFRLPPRSRASA